MTSQHLFQQTHKAAEQLKNRAESLISANHYDPANIREIAEEVTKRWYQLVSCTEERHKLVRIIFSPLYFLGNSVPASSLVRTYSLL